MRFEVMPDNTLRFLNVKHRREAYRGHQEPQEVVSQLPGGGYVVNLHNQAYTPLQANRATTLRIGMGLGKMDLAPTSAPPQGAE